jgi:RNA polymerase sigma-B factor
MRCVIPQPVLRQPALRQPVLRVAGRQRYSLVTAEPRQYGPNTCWDMSTSPNPLSIVASVPSAAAPATVAPGRDVRSRRAAANRDRGSAAGGDRFARRLRERQLFARYRGRHDLAAREELVERFLPLATRLAQRYRRGAEPLEDLVQVASVGLLKAIDRFDPERGTAFSSFAVPTIAGELKRYFRDKGWAVRVPRDLQELAQRVDRTTDRLMHELSRAPTVAEIADELGTTLEQVLEAREAAAAHRADSLDRPYDDEHGTRVADTLGAPEPGYLQAELSATLEAMMSVLSDREREILRLRFAEDLTQSEIGHRVGLSQMHISRLLRQAVARLREAAQVSEQPA